MNKIQRFIESNDYDAISDEMKKFVALIDEMNKNGISFNVPAFQDIDLAVSDIYVSFPTTNLQFVTQNVDTQNDFARVSQDDRIEFEILHRAIVNTMKLKGYDYI